jgi:UDP-N-acetylmuramoylalanine--D-glutamate ligase
MKKKQKIFSKKKILIYGLGKTGVSSHLFLKKNNETLLFDDIKKNLIINKKFFINKKKIYKYNFDYILVSPGINIRKCSLKKYISKNLNKVITDLDIFYSHYFKNKIISITGTNGKSTTAQILFEVLKDQKKDVRLVGNIGNPILNEKKVTPKTIFVIEASSYQLEYSKIFKANYAAILNISPDHIERHGNLNNYVKSKFKLIKNQNEKDFSFLDFKNKYLKKFLKQNKSKSKMINVHKKLFSENIAKIKNPYFLTNGNKQNLSFVCAISKKLGIRQSQLLKTINKFKGLNFRQQVIYKNKNFKVINDSKATSFSSTINILESLNKVHWLLGGIPKSGDNFYMSKKKCINFKAYIYGKNKNHFIKILKNKIRYESFRNLESALKKTIYDIKNEKSQIDNTILFSPSAASFDSYKNFEDRGKKFNELFKKIYLNK